MPETPGSKQLIRVYELSRELGMANAQVIDLCSSLGIKVKSHSSGMVEAQADRVRRKAELDGLVVVPEQAEEVPESEQPIRVHEYAKAMGITSKEVLESASHFNIGATTHMSNLWPDDVAWLNSAFLDISDIPDWEGELEEQNRLMHCYCGSADLTRTVICPVCGIVTWYQAIDERTDPAVANLARIAAGYSEQELSDFPDARRHHVDSDWVCDFLSGVGPPELIDALCLELGIPGHPTGVVYPEIPMPYALNHNEVTQIATEAIGVRHGIRSYPTFEDFLSPPSVPERVGNRPRLTEVGLKNFKSVAEATVPIRPLTVFVGPNSAGKSTLLKAILFIAGQNMENRSVDTQTPLFQTPMLSDLKRRSSRSNEPIELWFRFDDPGFIDEEFLAGTPWSDTALTEFSDRIGTVHAPGVEVDLASLLNDLKRAVRGDLRLDYTIAPGGSGSWDSNRGAVTANETWALLHTEPTLGVPPLHSLERELQRLYRIHGGELYLQFMPLLNGLPKFIEFKSSDQAADALLISYPDWSKGTPFRTAPGDIDDRFGVELSWDDVDLLNSPIDLDGEHPLSCDALQFTYPYSEATAYGAVPGEYEPEIDEHFDSAPRNFGENHTATLDNRIVTDLGALPHYEDAQGTEVAIFEDFPTTYGSATNADSRMARLTSWREYGEMLAVRAADRIGQFWGEGGSQFWHLGPSRPAPEASYLDELATSDSSFRREVHADGRGAIGALHRHGNELQRYMMPPEEDQPPRERRVRLGEAVDRWLAYIQLGEEVTTSQLGRAGLEIRVRTPDSRDDPLPLDQVGFGVGQAFPLIVMGLLVPPGGIFVVEEPESNLHPAAQQRLGDFFLALMKRGVQMIVETHSEYLVNRLRLRVAQDESGEVGREVGIQFVSKDENGDTQFSLVEVNDYGAVDEWPEGFFDQAADDARDILTTGLERRLAGSEQPESQVVGAPGLMHGLDTNLIGSLNSRASRELMQQAEKARAEIYDQQQQENMAREEKEREKWRYAEVELRDRLTRKLKEREELWHHEADLRAQLQQQADEYEKWHRQEADLDLQQQQEDEYEKWRRQEAEIYDQLQQAENAREELRRQEADLQADLQAQLAQAEKEQQEHDQLQEMLSFLEQQEQQDRLEQQKVLEEISELVLSQDTIPAPAMELDDLDDLEVSEDEERPDEDSEQAEE